MTSTSITQGPVAPLMSILTLPQADVDTDASGDLTVTFPDLQEVLFAILDVNEGIVSKCISVSGNTATFRSYYTASHNHVAWTVMGAETAGDVTAFVSVTEGDGTAQAGVKVGNAGGGSDIDIDTDTEAAVKLAAAASQTDIADARAIGFGL